MLSRLALRLLSRRTSRKGCAVLLKAALAGFAGLLGTAAGQDPPAGGPAGSREATWWAPSAADWQKPVQIRWQRTWADALAVAEETGQPILVCVNMDGEIASEHYAGVRYRDPVSAALYAPYVCVIASVYRHVPRDHDDQGRRIECPRFGGVTCGEHIAIEPLLHDKYFDEQRIAPRHIAVEPQSGPSESPPEFFDVFYAWTTEAVFETLREGIAQRVAPPERERPERSLPERVASRDSADRQAVEAAWQRGDRELRLVLLAEAVALGRDAPLALLRLALHEADEEFQRLALAALAQSESEEAVELILQALRRPLGVTDREGLVAALSRLGQSLPRASTLAAAYHGLTEPSTHVDVQAWSSERGPVERVAPAVQLAHPERVARLNAQNEVLLGDDGTALLALAEDFLLQADAEPDHAAARLLFRDVRRTALLARERPAADDDPTVAARLARCLLRAAHALGERAEAQRHAPAALALVERDPQSAESALLLELFAQQRQEALAEAVRARREWPPSWLSDVHAAWSVLLDHPHGRPADVLMHHDFLRWFGAAGEAVAVLEAGLLRFPADADLHDRLRAELLSRRGALGLEAEYERRALAPDAAAVYAAFAGYAALVAAETHRRAHDFEAARGSYTRARTHYERFSEGGPEELRLADHYVAVALAGLARLDFEAGDDERAVERLLAGFARDPDAAPTLDGLNGTAVETARLVLARLRAREQDEAAERLGAALEALGPERLRRPAYDLPMQGERPSGATRPGRDRPARAAGESAPR